MKRWLLICLAVMLVLMAGCSFKVERDTFYLPQNEVDRVEIQREYLYEDKSGSYFRHKVVTDQADMERICEAIRKLDVRKASNEEVNPIKEFSLIIIIGGEREHHLILTKEMAFYDQIAYVYNDADIYENFVDLYRELGYTEEDTEPDRF